MTQKRNNMMKSMQDENKRLAQEKRNRETKWKQDQQNQNTHEIGVTNNSHLMTENRMTTTSMHADHRYVPYHFKGLRPDQIADIDATRAQQVKDNKANRMAERDEEAAWA